MTTRVLIADDHRLILAGIKRAFEGAEEFEIVGEAESGAQVLPLTNQCSPHVVLLDLRFGDMNGLECLDAIRRRHPDVKVVVLSAFSDAEHIQAAFDRGATAYIVKSISLPNLASALRTVLDEPLDDSARVIGALPKQSDQFGLTARELSMLKAVARGLSNREIGKEFWVAEQTVKFHLSNIYRKLGVANRTEAARLAYARGLAA